MTPPDSIDAARLFARNFATLRYEDLPQSVIDMTKNEILDTLGVTIVGAGQPGPKQLRQLLEHWGGCPESSVIGTRLKLPAPNAAQLNATMAHARDYDDVHETAVMHPGLVTIMPALAIGESIGRMSGRELIVAVAAGADMICRLGLATRPGVSPMSTGWHFTTLYGYVTAALTAGRILGLSEERLVNAFGIAYHQSSGNGQCVVDGALTKRLGPGFAVRGGMMAALLAKLDVTGARDSLEGQQGLFAVYQRGEYDRDKLTQDLGRHFEGLNVSLKPYPCCRGVHASIDAALQLVVEHDIRAEDIAEIVISTGEANHGLLCTPFAAKVRPRNPVDTQFSIPWGVATALLRRRVAMQDFTASAMEDAEMLSLTAKISAVADPTLNSARGVEPARVDLKLNDGRHLSARVELARGSPQQPMTFADCSDKFRDCLRFAGADADGKMAARAIDMVANLDSVDNATELLAVFADMADAK